MIKKFLVLTDDEADQVCDDYNSSYNTLTDVQGAKFVEDWNAPVYVYELKKIYKRKEDDIFEGVEVKYV